MKSSARISSTWIVTIVMVGLLLFSMQLAAQDMGRHHGNGAWPDSLETVTVEGVVLQDSLSRISYLLDVDGDGIGDYGLAFGPDWYQPESGAQRPQAGDTVEIVGIVHDNPILSVIIVFEINGLVWREPVENWWHRMEWPDSLETVTISGTILTDTTYFYVHYYLDENGDGEPDYFLNFGPHWYQPEGVEKPSAGDAVTIEGALKNGAMLQTVIVFTIDGVTWREPAGPPSWGGRWIHGNAHDSIRIYCPTDSMSWVEIPPGAMHGGGHGGFQFPDSIFAGFLEMFGDSLPARPDSALFGFHFYMANPAGHCIHGKDASVHFMKKLRMAFHYGDNDSTFAPLAKMLSQNEVEVRYWNENSQQWIVEGDVAIDPIQQVIYLQTRDASSYYAIIVTSSATDVVSENMAVPQEISLLQNYPNPFNPRTVISYRLEKAGTQVNLNIYNVQGQLIRTLFQGTQSAGLHQMVWDGKDNFGNSMVSGVYIYKLQAGQTTLSRRMIFMK